MQVYEQFLKTSIDTANVKIQWKDFYDRCREIIEVFQIYGMAADEVEAQSPHSLSALMQVYEQLLKTSIDTANVKIQWKDFYDRCREIIEVFQMDRMAADEVEAQSPHSLSALMQAHQQLLKTDVERQFFKWTGWLQMRCKHSHHIVYRHLCRCMNNF